MGCSGECFGVIYDVLFICIASCVLYSSLKCMHVVLSWLPIFLCNTA